MAARADFLVARKTAAAGALVRISKESRLLLSSVVVRPNGGGTPEARLLRSYFRPEKGEIMALFAELGHLFCITAESFLRRCTADSWQRPPSTKPQRNLANVVVQIVRYFSP